MGKIMLYFVIQIVEEINKPSLSLTQFESRLKTQMWL